MRGGNTEEELNRDCKYVSSRGILFSCDVYPTNPVSSTNVINDIDLSNVQPGQTVYIQGSAVKDFSTKLANIPNKFILVSGDCDESIPEAIFSESEFKSFIESDKIIHWFSQNCVGKHPKLSPIPIGLDYHTRVKSDIWGPTMTPIEQEAELIAVKNAAKIFHKREIKAYANFHFNMQEDRKYTADRRDAKEKIPADCVFYEPTFTKTRLETYQNQIKYAFVVSPHGNGLDCIRTWEAIVLGCIPIVKTSSIDSVYAELPILIINEWSEVTKQKLIDTISEFKTRQFNYDRLNLKYWMDIIHSKNQSGGQTPNIFHFYNIFHYGDHLLNLKFLYNISAILKEKGMKIHYYYDTNYIKNRVELDRYVDTAVVELHPLTEKPETAIEIWMGTTINGENKYTKIDIWLPKLYKVILTHLGLQNLPIDLSLYQKEDYLLNIYEKFDPKYKDVHVLILNAPPASAQFDYDKQKLDALADRLSKKYKVVVIDPVNNITCTRTDGLTLQDIGAVSTHAKYIIGFNSGPLIPCFNIHTKNSVKKWILFDKIGTELKEVESVILPKRENVNSANIYVE
jgi:hypothetical protein